MQIHLLFNAILLTLSLATLLLTLVSYSVYKFRLLPLGDQNKSGPIKTEGVFFKRYLTPELRTEYFPNQGSSNEPQKTSVFTPLGRHLGAFFLLISVVIFISFMVETWATHDRHFFDGKEFAARVKTLQKKGLYEHFSFNRSFENLNLDESVPRATYAQMDYLVPELRKKSVQLFSTDENQKINPVASKLALSAWVDFLKDHQIPYSITASVPKANANAIFVLPQTAVLSVAQRSQINSLIAQGGNVVATGPIGVLNADGKAADLEWSAKAFSVSFADVSNIPTNEVVSETNTWISGNAAPWWEIPPGTQIQWPIIDSRYRATSSEKNNVAMWEIRDELTGENGRSPRAVLSSNQKGRTVWTLVDPARHSHENVTAASLYQDVAFFSMLAWAGRVPMVKIANWPNGKDTVVIPAVEIASLNGETKEVAKKLNELKLPATYFVNSDEAKSFVSFRKNLSNANDVILTLNEDIDLSNQDLKKQFEAIESARLETEYQVGQATSGFHVLNGSYDLETIKALIQNRIGYLSSHTQSLRLAPEFVSEGEFLMLPGSFIGSLESREDKGVHEKEELKSRFASVASIAADLHGMYVFQIRPEVYGEKAYAENVLETLKTFSQNPNNSFLTMNEVVKWWKNRDQIKVFVNKKDARGNLSVNVSNASDDATSAVAVWIDNGKEAKLAPVGNLGGLSESNIEIRE